MTHQLLATPLLVVVTGCAMYFPPAPALPTGFSGALAVVADSVFSSTGPSYCAPTEHLDYGTVPQGCVRESGDTIEWVNWTGANQVTRVVRSWRAADNASAMSAGLRLKEEITAQLGPAVRCPAQPVTTFESRWMARAASGVTTAVIVLESTPGGREFGFTVRPTRAAVTLVRTLGQERCGAPSFAPRPCRRAFTCRKEADSVRIRKSSGLESHAPACIIRACQHNILLSISASTRKSSRPAWLRSSRLWTLQPQRLSLP